MKWLWVGVGAAGAPTFKSSELVRSNLRSRDASGESLNPTGDTSVGIGCEWLFVRLRLSRSALRGRYPFGEENPSAALAGPIGGFTFDLPLTTEPSGTNLREAH
jgi:hypothetical protein